MESADALQIFASWFATGAGVVTMGYWTGRIGYIVVMAIGMIR